MWSSPSPSSGSGTSGEISATALRYAASDGRRSNDGAPRPTHPRHSSDSHWIRPGLQPLHHLDHTLPVVAHQNHVAPRFERRKRTTEVIAADRGGSHVEIVAEHDSPKAKLATKDISDPATRETRRAVIQTSIDDVRGHYARQVPHGEAFEGNQIGEPEVLVRASVDWKRVVRVGRDAAVPGKVFSDPPDSGIPHSREERACKRGHDIRIMMERTVANHRAHAATEIENRCEAEVDPARAQLHGRHPPPGARGPEREFAVQIMESPVFRRGGKNGESVAKPLHAATFVIDGDQKRRPFQLVNGIAQRAQLLTIAIVAWKTV